MKKKIIGCLVFVVAIVIIVGGLYFVNRKDDVAFVGEKVTDKINLETLNEEIKSIGELAATEYLYTDAGQFSNNLKIKGFDVPLTQKSFIVRCDGIVKAGIDVTKIKIDVNENNKIVKIQIPHSMILSHEIDHDSFETLDESNGIFNGISVEDVNTFIGDSKKSIEEKVVNNGLLDKADVSVKELLTKFIESYVDKEYVVNIETSEES